MPSPGPEASRAAPQVGGGDPEEERFYAAYEWCLNPILRLSDQLRHFAAELDRRASWRVVWQQQESTTNLYLLACGIACTIDDYLRRYPHDLSFVSERFPRLRLVLPLVRWLGNFPHAAAKLVRDRKVRSWRREWGVLVDHVCALVVGGEPQAGPSDWSHVRSSWKRLLDGAPLPPRVLRRRLRLPEGFRRQDLTHHDVLALVRRFAAGCPEWGQGPLVVLGPRTAGAYFAPLAAALLATLPWTEVSWLTVRPKDDLSYAERRPLRQLVRCGGRVLVVDDHPNTGRTLELLVGALRRLGIPAQHIAVLVPGHPTHGQFPLPGRDGWAAGVRLFRLDPIDTYKAHALDVPAMQALLGEYYGPRGWLEVAVETSAEVDTRNAELWDHCRDGFQVRLKRVYEVRLAAAGGRTTVTRLVAKSVGWGWLGYHAYIMGARLDGLVAPVIGLRDGILLSEWVGPLTGDRAGSVPPSGVLASYVALRAQRLRLDEDPRLEPSDSAWTGWSQLLQLLRRLYGPYVGRLKVHALRTRLDRYACPRPTAIDGRMWREDWISTAGAYRKVDFEHHNFGTPELDIIDPAYDLASATFEFGLSESAEQELVRTYVRESGDATVSERLIWYKLLYGAMALRWALLGIRDARRESQRAAWNARFVASRSFLAFQLHRECASLLPLRGAVRWSRRLFFLDLDGVFDSELLPFPHTTGHGLEALALLQSEGYAVVLNSGRSVEHIRQYCQAYGLPGGLAEHGSVFVDAVQGREVPFTDPEGAAQLRSCREAVRAIPGISVDPEYEHAVRAYRHTGDGTAPLESSELRVLFGGARFHRLTAISTSADTYIVQRGTDKGAGMSAVQRYLDCPDASVVAMGDSDPDVPMLDRADRAYAPSNCCAAVRALARAGRCRLLTEPGQRGFLAAVRDLIGARAHTGTGIGLTGSGSFLAELLAVADRSRLRQVVAALTWHSL
ncbi:MAG TPA: HAD hydrolase family protein [Gemmatimonadales bacterium]|nr:HAD hydrolase family protein [Gemmatimonadales bacterium]